MTTTTDILHVIADLLLMVIVFWYDWRIEELNSDVLENEKRISVLEQSFDATQHAEQLFDKVKNSKSGGADKPVE